MDNILTALYDSFYIRPETAALKQSADAIRALLWVVDDLTMMASDGSPDSFLCGFNLAWRLTNELNHYGNGRSTPADTAGLDARSAFQKEEESRQRSC